ncbi:MAG: ATP-binding protein, partial [Gammaproteobacteria bacterium]
IVDNEEGHSRYVRNWLWSLMNHKYFKSVAEKSGVELLFSVEELEYTSVQLDLSEKVYPPFVPFEHRGPLHLVVRDRISFAYWKAGYRSTEDVYGALEGQDFPIAVMKELGFKDRESLDYPNGWADTLAASMCYLTPGSQYIYIEEPEIGLHPKVLNKILCLILALTSCGFQVVVSTKSMDLIHGITTLWSLYEHRAREDLYYEAFGLPRLPLFKRVVKFARCLKPRIYSLENGQSVLMEEPYEGDIFETSDRYGSIVARAVNERDNRTGVR